MNCTDVCAILDDHAQSRLTAAEHCALDEHVASCEPCGHAWRAHAALLALPLPATPADLLDRTLREMASRTSSAPRRTRKRVVIVGAVLAAGAALAAVTTARLLERTGDQPALASSGPGDALEPTPMQTQSPPAGAPPVDADAANTPAVSVDDVQSEYAMMIRAAPDYPRELVARKLDGDVTLEFTIDKHGLVRDVRVVRSSDARFEAPAIGAVSQWKYLPRVAAGKRVAVNGVRTIIRFTLNPPPPPPADAKSGDTIRRSQLKMPSPTQTTGATARESAAPAPAHPADYETFDRSTAVAWERAAEDNFRGAELELDELRATYDLDDRQSNQVWGFYGYIYTQYGDYGRAIDAYEKAVALNTSVWPGQWTSLASLYFARHQYDRALKTLLAYKRVANGRISREATAMIEKLRGLGVTEETL